MENRKPEIELRSEDFNEVLSACLLYTSNMNTHFSLHKNQTLLSAYLSLLKVKHTARYADKLYN